jgi:glycosyltransferase involved in cell wall biosynthesis
VRIALDGQPLLAPLAGVGHYTEQLVHALARVGPSHHFYVVAPRPLKALRRGRVPLVEFPEPNVERVIPGWWATMRARVERRLGRNPEMGRGEDPPGDLFHATNHMFPFRLHGMRTVLTVHDVTILKFPQWHPASRLAMMGAGLAPAARRADRIVTPSQYTRRDILELLDVEPERVVVVPGGIDPIFAPQPEADTAARLAPLGLTVGEYLVYLGTIEPRKNLTRLLEAVESAEIGLLVLAGGHGWHNAIIRGAMARLERAGRVRELGYVPDDLRLPLLAGARAFVYPSLYEGFGLPPLEAMACGTPVLTSNVTALPEVMGDAALYVDPTDAPATAAALTRIWRDDALRADLRARGLARARLFSWDRTARETLDVYRAVLDQAPRPASLRGAGQ